MKDSDGRVFAFEVSNTFLTRGEAYRVLLAVQGAQPVRPPKSWQVFADEEFCEVSVDESNFVAIEPFGDNSCFWIGPKSADWNQSVDKVRKAFAEYRPFWGYLQWVPLMVAGSLGIWEVSHRVL